MLKQLAIDGGMRDVPEQHKQDRLFVPVKTTPGQIAMQTDKPEGDREA